MAVNLSVKNVPDALAESLRSRAERNRRSLQRELLSILEAAVGHVSGTSEAENGPEAQRPITIEELIEISRKLFPQETESSVNFIRQMRERGLGVLLTDHNVKETLRICDWAYIIDDGRVLKDGPPAAIVSDPDVRRKYLGDNFEM